MLSSLYEALMKYLVMAVVVVVVVMMRRSKRID